MTQFCALMMVALGCLQGAEAATPRPVEDLSIHLEEGRLQLAWSPVGLDTLGQPLTCLSYDVHRGETADFALTPQSLVATVTDTHWSDSLASERGFYRVQVRACAEGNPHDLVRIPAGLFWMGQTSVATPVHEVTRTREAWIGRHEVTNREFLEALSWAYENGRVTVVGDYVRQHGQNLLKLRDSVYDRTELRFDPAEQQFYLVAGTYNQGVWGPGFAYPAGFDPLDHPAKYLSWYGAACYCDWRSEMENLPPYYNGQWEQIPIPLDPYAATGYRLPTEAEWEFAARHPFGCMYPWGPSAPTCTEANLYIAGVNCVGW